MARRLNSNEFKISPGLIASLLTERMGSVFVDMLVQTCSSVEGDCLIDLFAGVMPKYVHIYVGKSQWGALMLQLRTMLQQTESMADVTFICSSTTVIVKTGTSLNPIVWNAVCPDRITVNDVMLVNACIKNTRAITHHMQISK